MKYIKVNKDFVLSDKQIMEKGRPYIWWEGSNSEEQEVCMNRSDEESYAFIKQLAPTIRRFFDENAKRVTPGSKRAHTTYGLKHHFQKLADYETNYDGKAFYSSNLAFILLMLEAGLDVYKEIDGSHGCYIAPYAFKKRRSLGFSNRVIQG